MRFNAIGVRNELRFASHSSPSLAVFGLICETETQMKLCSEVVSVHSLSLSGEEVQRSEKK